MEGETGRVGGQQVTDSQRRRFVSWSSILIGASLFISIFYTNRGKMLRERRRGRGRT